MTEQPIENVMSTNIQHVDMSPRDRVLAALRGEEAPRVPYELPVEGTVGARLDEYYGSKEWRSRIVNHIVQVSPLGPGTEEQVDEVRKKNVYGSVWRTDLRPFHLEQPALPEPSFGNYRMPDVTDFLDEEKEAGTGEQIQQYRDRFTVVRLGMGLFERSWTLRGYENLLVDSVANPDFFEELVERVFQLQMAFVQEAVKYPVDGIMFGDDWGDQRSVIMGPECWRKVFKPRVAQLYEAAHKDGKYALTHCCGSIAEIMPDVIEAGLDVLESVQPEANGMNPYQLKEKYGDKLSFWGGLGSQSILQFGTPTEIKEEVRRLRTEMSRNGGYILKPAKALQPGMPVENAVACLEAFTEE